MTTQYTARVCDPYGQLLTEISNFVDNSVGGGASTQVDYSGGSSALAYTLNVGKVGALRLTVPATFDANLFRLDGRIGVWRSINGRPPKLDGDTIFLIRKWEYSKNTTTITAYSANHLLWRRIIDYFAGTTYSSKTTPTAAGNLIKAFVNENMLAGIVAADRQGAETQADISAYLSNQANLTDGQLLAMQCAWRKLGDVVQDLSDASTQAGTYMAADIVAVTESLLELRTYATLRGVDHRASSSAPVILSEDAGSLANCQLTIDRSDEVTVAIVGGTGEGTQRLVRTSIDTTRIADSPLNRIEQFGDYSNVSDATALQDIADALVRAGRPRVEFTADVVETGGATRGIHYDLGDMVTAEFRGVQYDCRLDVAEVTLGGAGGQRSRAKIRSLT